MTQADRVLSTPPTNTPIITTRRRFLAVAAVGSIVGAGEASCHAAFNAFDVLLEAGATTLPGIVAKLAYLQDIAHRDAWMLTDRPDAARRAISTSLPLRKSTTSTNIGFGTATCADILAG